MKSFLSLDRSATFICRKNGIERKYLVYEGEEFVNFDLLYTRDTKEENGVIAELNITSWNEKWSFQNKATQKLAYYDTAVLIADGVIIENSIHRNSHFQYSSANSNASMHLCLKDVYYPIDWEALGIPAINIRIGLRINLEDGLTPTPSRESYITNEKTKQLLLKKIKLTGDWLVNSYNDTVKNFNTFMEAYEYIGVRDFPVYIGDTRIFINNILKYTSLQPFSPKIKGITLRDPKFYKNLKDHFLTEYNIVGYKDTQGVLRNPSTRFYRTKEYHLVNEGKFVLVGDNFIGNYKSFLKDKYPNDTMFIRKNDFVRLIESADTKLHYESYKHIIQLDSFPKKDWAAHIKEWDDIVKSITDLFINEVNGALTKEYEKWVENRKIQLKLAKATAIQSNTYVGLDKQEGDVTLAYTYNSLRGISFKKEAFAIKDLDKNRYLTILVEVDDNLKIAKELAALNKKSTVKFATVGRNEIKKIPDCKQFIKFKNYMTRDCKPFMRLASALLFNRLIKEVDIISSHRNGLFKHCVKPLNKDINKIREYVDNNIRYLSTDIEESIIQISIEKKLFDLSLWDSYTNVKNNIKKYEFLTILETPRTYDTASMEKYNTLINQMLLFRAKYYNDLPEGAKIVFN